MDVFCANAGVLRDAVMWKMTISDFERAIDAHLCGAFTNGQATARQKTTTVWWQHWRVHGRWNWPDNTAVNASVSTLLTRMVAFIPSFEELVAAAERGAPVTDYQHLEYGLVWS